MFKRNRQTPYADAMNSKTTKQTVDPDEKVHLEPPHLDLHCLLIQPFSVL